MTHLTPLSLWIDDALGVLTLRLEQEVALMRALRGETRQDGFLGLFVSDAEAEALIGELSGARSVTGAGLAEVPLPALWANVSAARLADPEGIWALYAARLGLCEAELDLMLLAMAPAIDPRFGRVYGYLNDDMARRHLTPALARVLLDRHGLSLPDVRALLAPNAPLRSFGLLRCETAPAFVDSALHICEDVLDEALSGQCPAPPKGLFAVTAARRIDAALPAALRGDPAYWAGQIAATRGQSLLLATAPSDGRALAPLLRRAALHGALLCLTGADQISDAAKAALAAKARGHALCLATHHPDQWADLGLALDTPALPDLPSFAARLDSFGAAPSLSDPALTALLTRAKASEKLSLTELLGALASAQSPRAAADRLTRRLDGALERLAARITTTFTRKDLVLPRAPARALEDIMTRRKGAARVLDDWGLGATFGKTRALTALFKGPSGTGKTMAASVIANTLGLPLYKIETAALVSKYIGETSKNIDAVFDAAEASDVALFFDEADAIFGKRSEVSDAHDRYANIETAFLLQRMESFSGLLILASNLGQNMDDAFLRRIDIVAEFPAPGPKERRALWDRLHGTNAPLAQDIDMGFLAEAFDLTGGEIRNCCLAAAHMAARAADGEITMTHLVRAVAAELVKQGKPLTRARFGTWEAAL